jgi:hypothetical protein
MDRLGAAVAPAGEPDGAGGGTPAGGNEGGGGRAKIGRYCGGPGCRTREKVKSAEEAGVCDSGRYDSLKVDSAAALLSEAIGAGRGTPVGGAGEPIAFASSEVLLLLLA